MGKYLGQMLFKSMDSVRQSCFSGITSDNMGNTQLAHQLVLQEVKTCILMSDVCHHLNPLAKDLAKLNIFKDISWFATYRKLTSHCDIDDKWPPCSYYLLSQVNLGSRCIGSSLKKAQDISWAWGYWKDSFCYNLHGCDIIETVLSYTTQTCW